MLEQFVQALSLEIEVQSKQDEGDRKKSLSLLLGHKESLQVFQLDPGLLFTAKLTSCPQ